MTNKRFIMEDGYMFDDEKGNAFLTVGDCCELLNMLNNENKQLMEENKELKLNNEILIEMLQGYQKWSANRRGF